MSDWLKRREHGTTLGIRFVVMLCNLFGRRIARGFVRILMVYYVALDRRARQASRRFLEQVLDRPVRFRDVLRHLTTFGLVTLDRVFFLQGRRELFEVEAEGSTLLDELTVEKRGALLLGAHVGSFEAMRARGSTRGHDIHVLAYLDNARKINAVLAGIDPAMSARVVSLGTVDSMIRAKALLEDGAILAMLGDRVGLSDKAVDVDFLGERAPLPTGPYLLASVLRCPVYLVFSVHLGGNAYRVWCEPFADRVELPRADREGALRRYAQRYADRLAFVAREYPFNWFNVYDFWNPTTEPPALESKAHRVAGPRDKNYSAASRSHESADSTTNAANRATDGTRSGA